MNLEKCVDLSNKIASMICDSGGAFVCGNADIPIRLLAFCVYCELSGQSVEISSFFDDDLNVDYEKIIDSCADRNVEISSFRYIERNT